jgi:hypothetical protein
MQWLGERELWEMLSPAAVEVDWKAEGERGLRPYAGAAVQRSTFCSYISCRISSIP